MAPKKNFVRESEQTIGPTLEVRLSAGICLGKQIILKIVQEPPTLRKKKVFFGDRPGGIGVKNFDGGCGQKNFAFYARTVEYCAFKDNFESFQPSAVKIQPMLHSLDFLPTFSSVKKWDGKLSKGKWRM